MCLRPGRPVSSQIPSCARWTILLIQLATLFLAAVPSLRADTLTGTVKDPSGVGVPAARVEVRGEKLAQPIAAMTNEAGKFTIPNLPPGNYTVTVIKSGFAEWTSDVDLRGTADLAIALVLAEQRTQISVTDTSAEYGNTDPVYRALREIGLGDSFHCENFRLKLDVGTFEFKSGTFTLFDVVDGAKTGIVFTGTGHFTLTPFSRLDTRELTRRAGKSPAEEDFSAVIFRFSPSQISSFERGLGAKTSTPADTSTALRNWQAKMRHRHETPEGMTQVLLEDDLMDNVDADVTAGVYNPQHPFFFNAYISGSSHKDLRFFVRARTGAIPQLDSPEEVALINCDGAAMDDGIWYSSHLQSEFDTQKASSMQEKRIFVARKYTIETAIGKNDHLFGRATVNYQPLISGERVMKFGLLSTLRVSRVTDERGDNLHFIQENRKQDGSFYVVLAKGAPAKEEHSVTIEYGGDKVLKSAGNGSYYVGARESWYPNLNPNFGSKSLYDLTFKVPPKNVVISVGKLEKEYTEGGFAASHWVTPVPVAVAGFNYGHYLQLEEPDSVTHYSIAGYYLSELPDFLQPYKTTALSGMSPTSMTKYALDQTRAQMQLCTLFFGKAPYNNIYITEQPNFNFGQSWPNLVYLPISAYIDSTQRWELFGHIDAKFSGFVQEVTPHEVAHQWFGHGVTWASYHDQWLSEGFADFAAGLFLQEATGPKWEKDYLEYWERQRTRILDKNNFGIAPNDAGPLWMGLRLISPNSSNAYQGVTYSKGAYVLQMLRSMMRDEKAEKNRDQAFIDMMHDYMETFRDTPASTEAFKMIAEKHMTKQMDLQKNGKLDWFFWQWVYGTEVPRYSFQYEVKPAENGKVRVHGELTQSEVDDQFAMLVPLYADVGNGMGRIGQVVIVGNSTRTVEIVLDHQPKKVAVNVYKDVLSR